MQNLDVVAQAIRERWSAPDASTLLLADQDEFFRELASAALFAAVYRDPGKLIKAKRKDGSPIELRFWDKGDMIPGRDDNGNMYEAYTSRFCSVDRSVEFYVQTDRWKAEDSGDAVGYRIAKDKEALDAHGIDVSSIDWKVR
jgi:hypothetical protein